MSADTATGVKQVLTDMIKLYKGNTKCLSHSEVSKLGKVQEEEIFTHPACEDAGTPDVVVIFPAPLSHKELVEARDDDRNKAAAAFNLHHSYTAHWRPDAISQLLDDLRVPHSLIKFERHEITGGLRFGSEMGDATSYGIMLDASAVGPQTLKRLQEELGKMQSGFLQGMANHMDRLAEDRGIPPERRADLVQALAKQLGVDLTQAAGRRRA